MKTTAQSLNDELGTDLLAQLSVEDQREVDRLNDEIQKLTLENRKALKERVKVRLILRVVIRYEGVIQKCNLFM